MSTVLQSLTSMSEEQEDHLRQVIRSEMLRIAAWMIGVFGIVAIGLASKAIVDSTRMNDHIGDGHPGTVVGVIQSQAIDLSEIKATQQHIREDISEIKKKLESHDR